MKLLLFLTLTFGQAHGAISLKLVASMTDLVITDRDVHANYILDKALFGEGKDVQLRYGSSEFYGALNRLVIEWMVYREAISFGVGEVSPEDLTAAENQVQSFLKKNEPASLKISQLDYSKKDLAQMIERKLKANRFIKYKNNSSVVAVTDEEAREYFSANRLRFGSSEFSELKGSIKSFLSKKNSEDRLRDWFDLLKKKHKVRNLYGQGPQISKDSK